MKFLVVAALFTVVAAQSQYTTYPARKTYPAPAYQAQAPAYKAPAPAYSAPAYRAETYPPQPYSFSYEVKDAESYNDYGHSESSDGKLTTGSYRVALPDGRTQVVNYRADANGYVADVKYEGEPRYPESKAAPAYKAQTYSAPAYKAPASPAYKAPAYSAPKY